MRLKLRSGHRQLGTRARQRRSGDATLSCAADHCVVPCLILPIRPEGERRASSGRGLGSQAGRERKRLPLHPADFLAARPASARLDRQEDQVKPVVVNPEMIPVAGGKRHTD